MAPGSGWELPPRARRILKETRLILDQLGTTSACAENTSQTAERSPHRRNYLRVRGEYQLSKRGGGVALELPPRARRIRSLKGHQAQSFGTTSACAENTFFGAEPVRVFRNYLRVRGEYKTEGYGGAPFEELPPRARRIPAGAATNLHTVGTTSACAENTLGSIREFPLSWNYLRVRGEYTPAEPEKVPTLELPPRARRILLTVQPQIIGVGTTSACAENTRDLGCFRETRRNYLRVRGEYGVTASMAMRSTELPPRARRIHGSDEVRNYPSGTTSACAENTPQSASPIRPGWNYLRVRGEYKEKQ